MKKSAIILLVFVALIITMVVTCPDKKAHTEAIAEEVTGGIPILSDITGWLAKGALDVKNFGVISLGYIDDDVVTIGAFNHVWCINTDD